MRNSTSITMYIDRQLSCRKRLKIEKYQRWFEWTKKEYSQLFQDLYNLSKDKTRDDYYLQTITILEDKETNTLQIVDGQQRITNIFLILIAYINVINSYELHRKNEMWDNIRGYIKGLMYIRNSYGGKPIPSIVLQNKDNEYLEAIYNNNETLIKENKKRSLLTKAYDYYYKELNALLNYSPQEFHDFYHFGINRASVIVEECESIREATECFKNKNSKGKSMKKGNVVISELYRGMEEETMYEDEKQKLINIIEQIRAQYDDDVDLFMFKFFYHKINENKIPNIDKAFYHYKTKHNVVDIIKEMGEYFNLEEHIRNTFEPRISFENFPHLMLLATDMFKFNITDKKIQEDMLKIAEAFLLRRRIIGISGQQINVLQNIIEKIYKCEGNIIDNFIKYLHEQAKIAPTMYKMANDEEVYEYMMKTNAYKNKTLLRHILTTINNNNTQGEQQNIENDTIEHILPQSEGNDNIINLIGNLTLVQMNMNQKLSNKKFEDKKQLYKESTYRINRYFDNITTWGEKEIIDRTEKIAQEVTQIWKV